MRDKKDNGEGNLQECVVYSIDSTRKRDNEVKGMKGPLESFMAAKRKNNNSEADDCFKGYYRRFLVKI